MTTIFTVLGLLTVAAAVWYAVTREPDPLEDQDWRDEL